MEKIPISAVWPMQNGVLQILFQTGSSAVVDLRTKLQPLRFSPLLEETVWKSAETDGKTVRWYRDGFPVAEVACDELLGMIIGQSY